MRGVGHHKPVKVLMELLEVIEHHKPDDLKELTIINREGAFIADLLEEASVEKSEVTCLQHEGHALRQQCIHQSIKFN